MKVELSVDELTLLVGTLSFNIQMYGRTPLTEKLHQKLVEIGRDYLKEEVKND